MAAARRRHVQLSSLARLHLDVVRDLTTANGPLDTVA
jgi:hypothetical protein